MKKYDREKREQALALLNADTASQWHLVEESICHHFEFKSFSDAFAFMTAMALHAEKIDHHPDWRNCYRRVEVCLTTYDVHGLTQQDFDFALACDRAASHYL